MSALRLSLAVGQTVRELRDARGWTQEVAARRLHATGLAWSRSQLADLEVGQRDIRLGEVILLAEAFGVGVHELLPASGQIEIGTTERPAIVLRGMLTGQSTPNSDLLGPTDVPGMDPERHGAGPYWIRNLSRGSRIYSAAEVDQAKRLGLDIDEYRKRQGDDS
jgi:transcriptional regulator with XRE-family HTH domain